MSRVTTLAAVIFLMASSAFAQVTNPDGERGQQFLNGQPELNAPIIHIDPLDRNRLYESEGPSTIRLADSVYEAASLRGDGPELVFVIPCEDDPSPPITWCPITSFDFGTVATGAPGPFTGPRSLGPHIETRHLRLSLFNLSETAVATNLVIHLDTPDFQWSPEGSTGGCRALNEQYEENDQYQLQPGESCRVLLRFAPTEPGPLEGTLTISSEEGTQATLTLQGTGGDDVLLFGQFHDWETMPMFTIVRNAHYTYWPERSAELADDFVVEGPGEWTIKEIGIGYFDTYAVIRGTLPLFDVHIVEDEEGYPGDTVVCAAPESEVLWFNDNAEVYTQIELSTPCTVSPGHYWLRIRPIMEITMVTDLQISWVVQTPVTGEEPVIPLNPAVWRNPGGKIVEGCEDWTYVYPAVCTHVGWWPIEYAIFWLTGEVGTVSNEGDPNEIAQGLSHPSPNPVRERAVFDLTVDRGQYVTVEVFDIMGRRVQTLYTGSLAAGATENLSFNASRLPSGVYVIRALGEDFVDTRRVTVVR